MDTTEAGDGEVEVDVTYDGRQMATRVSRSGQLHQVSFMPEGAGVYSIEVDFANMDVPGNFVLQLFSRSQYDRLLASSCRPSVTLCIVAFKVGVQNSYHIISYHITVVAACSWHATSYSLLQTLLL